MRSGALLLSLAFLVSLLAGCLGASDDAPAANAPAHPSYVVGNWTRPLPVPLAGFEHVTSVPEAGSGAGIAVWGDHAYVSGSGGLTIINVSNPIAPVVVGTLAEPSRDVDLVHYQDGRVVAALASGAIDLVDVTDPSDPILLGSHPTQGAVHNIATVPGTAIIYNSRSLDLPGVDIIDASDPDEPIQVGVFGDLTCHDVTFAIEIDRAYCAGVRETQVWDISDPSAPRLTTRIVNPAIMIHHAAIPIANGTLLAIADEFAGSTPAAAGCLAATDAPAGPLATISDPFGAVWFYDMTDEIAPRPLSWVAVPLPTDNIPPTPCTAHFGGVLEDVDHLVMGWRAAGSHLIDYSDPTAPRHVAQYQAGGDTWESRVTNGYVFTGHSEMGMEILTFA